jgi:hypothetical protein
MKLVERIFKDLLLWNYSLSVYINDFREANFSKTCVRITSIELFFLLVSAQILLFPKINSNELIALFVLFILFNFMVSFFYSERLIYRKFKDFSVPNKFSKIRDTAKNGTMILIGSCIFGVLFIQCIGLSLLEIYNYHTRYFYWNWNY